MRTRWIDYLIHLRLHYQFLLSPVFLLAALLSGEPIGMRLIAAFLSYHLFLFAGVTAFNSAYDKDEGPVGGLEKPPPTPPHLLLFSVVWQIIGFGVAAAINPILATIYAVIFVMSFAYTYPRIRLKGRPLASLVTVALGHGVLPFLAAWSLPRGEIASAFSTAGLLAIFAVTAVTVGFYPLTEIYQLEEDALRGDMTLARWLGPVRSFNFARIFIAGGALSAIMLTLLRFTPAEAVGLMLEMAAILFYLTHLVRGFRVEDIHGNFRRIMSLYTLATLGFFLWLGTRLAMASF